MSYRSHVALLACGVLVALMASVLPMAQPAVAAANLRLSRTEAASGDRVRVAGSGFHAGDSAVIASTFAVQGRSQRVAVAAIVNGAGSFLTSFTIPSGTVPGTYHVTAMDFHTNQVTQIMTVLPVADVRAGSSAGTVHVDADGAFYVRGAGFLATEPIAVSLTVPLYDGNAVILNRSARADSAGRFGTLRLAVPHGARAGTVTLRATGTKSNRSGRVPVVVSYHPSLTVEASSVRPGTAVAIVGHGYVPVSRVRSAVTIPRATGQQETITRDASTDSRGIFSTSLAIPSDVRAGRYTISATDLRGGFTASAQVTVSVHPVLVVQPSLAVPGQTVVARGTGFGTGVTVAVSASFPLSTGGSRTVSVALVTGSNGSFSVGVTVPSGAATADVAVIAQATNSKAQARLSVRVPPTPIPTSTATPVPPTSTPVPPKHRALPFKFQYVSLWYHPIRQGTNDHLVIQGQPHRFLGVWVHIIFPNGRVVALYGTTNRHGFWETDFHVPRHAVTNRSNQAVITVRLWKGPRLRKTFIEFTILR